METKTLDREAPSLKTDRLAICEECMEVGFSNRAWLLMKIVWSWTRDWRLRSARVAICECVQVSSSNYCVVAGGKQFILSLFLEKQR
jgi:hypothetical protein